MVDVEQQGCDGVGGHRAGESSEGMSNFTFTSREAVVSPCMVTWSVAAPEEEEGVRVSCGVSSLLHEVSATAARSRAARV